MEPDLFCAGLINNQHFQPRTLIGDEWFDLRLRVNGNTFLLLFWTKHASRTSRSHFGLEKQRHNGGQGVTCS